MLNTTKTARIIARREGIDIDEATEIVESVMDEVYEAIACGDYDLAEEIIYSELELELDYFI